MASVDTLFDILRIDIASWITMDFWKGKFMVLLPFSDPVSPGLRDGEIACPAPVTLEILCRHQIPYSSFPADMEMTTPTGVAIFANIADRIVDAYPPMTPLKEDMGRVHGASREDLRS